MLYGWMKSLIIYLILSGIVMNMTPGKSYKRYISAFTGLIILIILAEPLSYIFHISSGDLTGIVDELAEYSDYEDALTQYDDIGNYYEMSLASSIRLDMSDRGYLVDSVDVITDDSDNVLKCTVVTQEDNTADKDEIKKYISEVYNIEINNIYIVRR